MSRVLYYAQELIKSELLMFCLIRNIFQARDRSISGMSITKMMQFMPLLEETKMEMYTELMACTMPIFKDRTVLILMVLITVFDLESDESVKRIRMGS